MRLHSSCLSSLSSRSQRAKDNESSGQLLHDLLQLEAFNIRIHLHPERQMVRHLVGEGSLFMPGKSSFM